MVGWRGRGETSSHQDSKSAPKPNPTPQRSPRKQVVRWGGPCRNAGLTPNADPTPPNQRSPLEASREIAPTSASQHWGEPGVWERASHPGRYKASCLFCFLHSSLNTVRPHPTPTVPCPSTLPLDPKQKMKLVFPPFLPPFSLAVRESLGGPAPS